MPALKGFAWTFDTVASTYEKLRPGYVKELYQGDVMYTRFLKTKDAVQYQQVDVDGKTCCNAMISQIENVSC